MDYCPWVKRRGVKIRDHTRGSIPGRWRRCIGGGRNDAFTLIEVILIVAMIGILAGIAAPIYADFRYRAQVETTKAIIRQIEAGINMYYYKYGTYPPTLSDAMIATPLDPWGNPYQYLPSTDPDWDHNYRFDRNLKPLNSDFDLYSMGVDGKTARNLNAAHCQDDVIRAENGGFVDLGELY